MEMERYQHPWDTKPDVFKSDYKNMRTHQLVDLKLESLYYIEKEKVLRLIKAIGHHTMRHMVEEKDDFPTYKFYYGYDEKDIIAQKKKVITRVNAVNEYMKQLGKQPIFLNPNDTYKTALEYYELMRFQYGEDIVQKYPELVIASKNPCWKKFIEKTQETNQNKDEKYTV